MEKNNQENRIIRILLVEDNEADIKITLRAFKRAEVKNRVYVVHDGQEALDYLKNEGEYNDSDQFPRPDIILMDINMPRLNGFDTLNVIKANEHFAPIPVIMLTSSKNDNDIDKSYNVGAASYIQKPVSYDDFCKVVDGFNVYWSNIIKLPKNK